MNIESTLRLVSGLALAAVLVSCGKPSMSPSAAPAPIRKPGQTQGGGYVPYHPTGPAPAYPPVAPLNPQMTPPPNVNLANEQIFTQGDSNWCWAYSSFHTLRAYYLSTQSTDPAVAPWRQAIMSIDSPDGMRNFMNQHSSPDQGGDPIQFVQIMQQAFRLPQQNWSDTYAGDASATSLLQQVDNNLLRNIPSTFCNSDHCIAVLGVVNAASMAVGGAAGSALAATYNMGDSGGGPTNYQMSGQELVSAMDVVMMLH